jgi:4-amino-4-deoxy-L-arabinose transferase-like glycosyltransferase
MDSPRRDPSQHSEASGGADPDHDTTPGGTPVYEVPDPATTEAGADRGEFGEFIRTFGLRISAVGAIGLAVRWAAVFIWYRRLTPLSLASKEEVGLTDNAWYWIQSKLLADGKGFANPFYWYQRCMVDHVSCEPQASAGKPPLYTAYLAIFHRMGLHSPLAMRLASGLLGAAAVVMIGYLARRISRSDRVGLIAGVIAALYPNLWTNDGLILSESLQLLLIAVVGWCAYRVIERRDLPSAAWLGAAVGAAALTRSEAQFLVPFLLVPLALWALRSEPWRRRIAVLLVSGLTALVVVAPWLTRNLETFKEPVGLSVGTGFVLGVSNCDQTYSGELLGYWSTECGNETWPAGADESQIDVFLRRTPTRYIKDHLGRVPVVVAARVGRMWNVYRPFQGADLDVFFERRGRLPTMVGLWSFYGIGVFGAVGAVALYRRRVSLVPLVSLMALVTFSAAVAIPLTRYRIAAEVSWVVLGAIGVDAVWSRLQRGRTPSPHVATATPAATSNPTSAVDR